MGKPLEPTEFKASVRLGHRSNGYGEGNMCITIVDQQSHLPLVEVELSLEQFMRAIVSQPQKDCAGRFYNTQAQLGKSRVQRRKVLTFRRIADDDKRLAEQIEKHPFVVSKLEAGWRMDHWHRVRTPNSVQIHMFKFVKAKP